MLKITKKVEYALIAIRHLQENQDNLVPVSDISASYGIPKEILAKTCLLYTSPSPRDRQKSRMPSSA